MKWLCAVAIGLGLMSGMAGAQDLPPAPAGHYKLDLGHARLLFRVNHIGVSNYTAMFTRFDADFAV